ncbi:nuclear transport factor 2 family protein [Amycolatopsis pithecellobii]|uniref:nuclear transport factor 2 family protein n=1 Tax=Amycolatopsis pithecellobii TaxID=664692 RepID=UPI00140D0C6D|nr:nuclear transport factor 2 family protein [Amycolatopsis pithecellobii]
MSEPGDALAEVLAQLAIRDALYRFCRGVDRGDADAMFSAFHPDATDSHGPGGPEHIVPMLVQRFDETPRVGQHHITNVHAVVDGDVAAVESYFLLFNAQSEERGGEHELVGGRYLDRFERRNGEWRIAAREIVVDVARSPLFGSDLAGALPYVTGGRREKDPSAALFTQVRNQARVEEK